MYDRYTLDIGAERIGEVWSADVRWGLVRYGMSWFLGEAIEVVCGKVWSGSVR